MPNRWAKKTVPGTLLTKWVLDHSPWAVMAAHYPLLVETGSWVQTTPFQEQGADVVCVCVCVFFKVSFVWQKFESRSSMVTTFVSFILLGKSVSLCCLGLHFSEMFHQQPFAEGTCDLLSSVGTTRMNQSLWLVVLCRSRNGWNPSRLF